VEGLWRDDPLPPAAAGAQSDEEQQQQRPLPQWLAGIAPPPRLLESRGLIPYIPPDLAWPEVLRWSGRLDATTSTPAQHVWPGECPVSVSARLHLSFSIQAQVEAGARHLAEDHLDQAAACWGEILRLVDSGQAAASGMAPDQVELAHKIATRNIRAVKEGDFFPYTTAAKKDLAALVRANVPSTRVASQWK
jgi:hypothetical protein